jgi:hypothetical protein
MLAVTLVQELLARSDVPTAMTYLHVLNRCGQGVDSPVNSMKTT